MDEVILRIQKDGKTVELVAWDDMDWQCPCVIPFENPEAARLYCKSVFQRLLEMVQEVSNATKSLPLGDAKA